MPLNEEHARGELNHLYGEVLLGLCFPLTIILFHFSHLTRPRFTPSSSLWDFWSRWIPKQDPVGKLCRHIIACKPFPFWPEGGFFYTGMFGVSQALRMGSMWPLCSCVQAGLAPLLILSLPLFNSSQKIRMSYLPRTHFYLYIGVQISCWLYML